MSLRSQYTLPPDDDDLIWLVNGALATKLGWEYDDARPLMSKLYGKAKQGQWDAASEIDWTLDLDPENPQGLPDEGIGIFGSDVWNRLDAKQRAEVRRHSQSWSVSQFLHGEQGALVCSAKLVQEVPELDAKLFAATQVMDEARHVEVYTRLLRDKFELAYPITPPLKALLGDILRDSRWDLTYLGMQVLIEGLALAAFAGIRDVARHPLARQVNAYVMRDEARHVAYGQIALHDYYLHLTQREREEREEFAIEACYLLRDRFVGREVLEQLDLPVDDCLAYITSSIKLRAFRTRLFSRIVPGLKAIGLWGPRIQRAFTELNLMGFADTDLTALVAQDEEIAAAIKVARASRGE